MIVLVQYVIFQSRTDVDKCGTGWWSNGSQTDEVGGELTWCFCLTKKICYFKDLLNATRLKIMVNICTANAPLPTFWEYQKFLKLIAVNSFRRDIRSQNSSLMYFSTKTRTDAFGNLNVNHVFLFPPARTSATVGLHFQSFQHSTSWFSVGVVIFLIH